MNLVSVLLVEIDICQLGRSHFLFREGKHIKYIYLRKKGIRNEGIRTADEDDAQPDSFRGLPAT